MNKETKNQFFVRLLNAEYPFKKILLLKQILNCQMLLEIGGPMILFY